MKSFSELNLIAPLMKSIQELGYETPTPIQAQTIPILLNEKTDFLGLAATGTGKTAAYGIPLLANLVNDVHAVQAVILCPTRELALQVAGQIELLGRHLGTKALAIYGGSSFGEQIRGLREGATVVVGTPGRIVDHLTRGTLKLSQMKTLVLDEADEMISMGFKDDLEKIMAAVPKDESRIWFFSATMDQQVSRVANKFLRKPKQVQVNRTEILSATVEQFYYPTREGDKPEILCKLIEAAENFYGLIFCQTKQLVVELTSYLVDQGYRVDCLHGDKDQSSRERTMKAFRDRKVKVLVCTDVASRGLDVKDITHVINYSLPRELENYVHRIGRTARSGKTGIAMNLVTPSHRHLIYDIEKLTKSRMQEGKIPTRKEIGSRKVTQLLPSFSNQANFFKAQEILGEEWKTSLATMSSEEVAARFLALMMPELFNERTAKPVNQMSGKSLSDGEQGRRMPRRQQQAAPDRRYEQRHERNGEYSKKRRYGGPATGKPSAERRFSR